MKLRILKVGGSVITDKGSEAFEKLKPETIDEVCRAIAENWQNLILVHGAGSFGHPHVKKFGLTTSGASRTHLACMKLNHYLCSRLQDAGVAVLPVHPFSFYLRNETLKCNLELIERALNSGFLPVLHGDVIFGRGIEVLSGDDIVIHLSEHTKPSRIGFATDVDGVLYRGEVLGRLDRETFEDLIRSEGAEKGERVDVTGGMLKKVQKIFELKSKCEVFVFRGNYSNIKKFLNGGKVGTEVIL